MCPSKVTILSSSVSTLTDWENGFLLGIIEGEGHTRPTRIITELASGMSIPEIARQLGVSPKYPYFILEKAVTRSETGGQ